MESHIQLKGVKRIVKIRRTDDGPGVRLIVYKAGEKRRRGKKALRPMEKALRKNIRAQKIFADAYLARHRKSSNKKRDGWLRDMNYNLMSAGMKSARSLRP